MDVVKALQEHSEVGAQVVDLLYGDQVGEVIKALNTPQQQEKKKNGVLNNIALAGNAASTVAGPAAIYSAVKGARNNSGGIPRDIASSAGPRLAQSKRPRLRKIGQTVNRAVSALNAPQNRKARTAAAIAGGTMVGLQAINVGTDAISTKLLADQKKKQSMAKSADFEFFTEISKASDDDKRLVYGWASITSVDGVPVTDLQGDLITIEEIEKSAHEYVTSSRKGGFMHKKTDDGPMHVSDLVESVIIDKSKKESLGLPPDGPEGWFVGFRVNDDDVWQDVKSGKLAGFSIHGSGVRREL